jgi:hypothetical protein
MPRAQRKTIAGRAKRSQKEFSNMARQTNNSKSARTTKPAAKASKAPATTTAVRNSAIPKVQSAPRIVTNDMIAVRAYEISQSPECGSELDNWCRAERELKGR